MINGLEIGTRLPPERQLLKTFDVSMTTLKRALNNLAGRGILRRIVGRGTFVLHKPEIVIKQERSPLIFTWEPFSNFDFSGLDLVPENHVFQRPEYYRSLADALRKKVSPDIMLMASQFPIFQEKATFMNLDYMQISLPATDGYFANMTNFFSDYSFRFALPLLFSCQLIAVSSHSKYDGLAARLQEKDFSDFVEFATYIYEELQQPMIFFPEYLQLFLMQSGPLFDPTSGDNLFDTSNGQRQLEGLKDLIDSGRLINPFCSSIKNQIDLFCDGKTGVLGPFFAFNLHKLKGDFELILPPFGKSSSNFINAMGLTIHSETALPDASAILVKHMGSDESVLKLAYEGRGFPAQKHLCKRYMKANHPLIYSNYERFEDEVANASISSNDVNDVRIRGVLIDATMKYLSGKINLQEAADICSEKLSDLVQTEEREEYLGYQAI
ncbi:MAG: GntR family transcriptional regulator [Lentisphaeria bacterium]|nr:GntR family transcriptional regulator [Lentisphaeria bacterium]NQZ71403.1 GntR family transcriptional regulator [Lentisphaeria bacterium]